MAEDSRLPKIVVVEVVSSDTESTMESSPDGKPKKRKFSSTADSVKSEKSDNKQYIQKIGLSLKSKKRELSACSADNSSNNESPISIIPRQTSEWDNMVLTILGVGIVQEAHHPYEVFTRPVIESDGSSTDFEKYRSIFRLTCGTDSETIEHKIKFECVKHLFNNVLDFSYEHIQDASQQTVCDLYRKIKELQEIDLMEAVPEINPTHYFRTFPSLRWSCMRIIVEAGNFIQHLLLMIRRKNQYSCDLNEGEYQELFVRFVRIFGLNIISVPNVPAFKTQIGSVEVSSVPDALVIHPTCENLIMASVEVRKEYSTEEDSGKTRKSQKVEKTDNSVKHLSSKLKGQHIGGMLSVLQHSVFGEAGVYGFVVQGTEVTVSALSAEKNYLGAIKEGSLPKTDKDLVSIKYSEKCNILTKKGRLELIQTLFDMATFMERL